MLEFYRFKCFKKQSDLLHAVSNKSTEHPYCFSLALHTGEREQEIIKNRALIAKHLGTNSALHFIVANQTHSDHIKIITAQETKGWEGIDDAIEDCDALITQEKNVILTILTADCVPILLYDPKHKV
ncbi:MAG TPA: laccase domain-containing protein, partial [Sulfurovum sp.]|nr:laccase domain-containing protein [Sulfurovum sp.]